MFQENLVLKRHYFVAKFRWHSLLYFGFEKIIISLMRYAMLSELSSSCCVGLRHDYIKRCYRYLKTRQLSVLWKNLLNIWWVSYKHWFLYAPLHSIIYSYFSPSLSGWTIYTLFFPSVSDKVTLQPETEQRITIVPTLNHPIFFYREKNKDFVRTWIKLNTVLGENNRKHANI